MLEEVFWRAWSGIEDWVDFWAEDGSGVCCEVLCRWWGRGLKVGTLERWGAGDCLGGVWQSAVDWSEGNSGGVCAGFAVGVSGDQGWFQWWKGRERVK